MRILIAVLLLIPSLLIAQPRVTLETNYGDIVLSLDEQRAPQSVANFLNYVDEGFYNDTIFHRVISGFMVQGGGFDSKGQRKATHDPIDNEADNGLRNRRGTVAMARTQNPHSASSQFFINHRDNRSLDHTGKSAQGWGYAVFGKVESGMDVVDNIARVSTGNRRLSGMPAQNVPLEPVVILRAFRTDASDNPETDHHAHE